MECHVTCSEIARSTNHGLGVHAARRPFLQSLLCTATNSTLHEFVFNFPRRSPNRKSLPVWLSSPGPVFLRKFVRLHKNGDLAEAVDQTDVNPIYDRTRFPDGRESTVSVRHLAPRLGTTRYPENETDTRTDHENTEVGSSDTSKEPGSAPEPASYRRIKLGVSHLLDTD